MQRTSVQSTSIQSIGFDSQREILEIEWPRGAVYQYWRKPGVELSPSLQDHYVALCSAENPDQYFNQNLRGKKEISYQRMPAEVKAQNTGAQS